MSWSLQISGGDFSYGSQGLAQATGGAKLTQDLTCCLLEPMGNDNMHPNYGSVLDGGVDSDGNFYNGYIGSPNDSATAALVSAEITRICQAYQEAQIARNNADMNTYGTSTLSIGEALLAVNSVNITQLETAMQVAVSLSTGSGTTQLTTTIGS